ncbi:hypothetical protein MNBD_GAMMA17-878 [hydrothermal vent metagenome]|uniref:Uncharacterized protein n=1 Tax=hydrothermal vent metagenome TaxID=652676 RepID=A0A3B0ZKS6_9ZZZZ
MTTFYLIAALTTLSGLLYLLILLIKNFVSRKNLKRALGVNFGSHMIPDNQLHAVQYCYVNHVNHQGPGIDFFMMCAAMPHNSTSFIVVRERVFDKFFKLLGISSEFQTGYRWFDKRYYIISEPNKIIQDHLLVNEKTCKIIADLLAEGFDYIKLEGGTLKTGFSTFTGWRWFRSGVIERSATLLTQLRDSLEADYPRNKRPKRAKSLSCCGNTESFVNFYIKIPDKLLRHHSRKWVRQRKLWLLSAGYVFSIGIAFMVVGVFLDPYSVIEFEQVFTKGILYLAFPVMLLHLLAAGIHLSGRARSHKELSWIAVLNGVGYTFIAIMMLQISNGVFDNSPVVSHPARLIDTDRYSSSKGPDDYYIIVESWRNSDTEKLSVSQSFYNSSTQRINETVNILTKAGLFNIEWLYDYRFDSEVPRQENKWE